MMLPQKDPSCPALEDSGSEWIQEREMVRPQEDPFVQLMRTVEQLEITTLENPYQGACTQVWNAVLLQKVTVHLPQAHQNGTGNDTIQEMQGSSLQGMCLNEGVTEFPDM